LADNSFHPSWAHTLCAKDHPGCAKASKGMSSERVQGALECEVLPAGEFTMVKQIAEANHDHDGIFKYRWARAVQDGGHVVVKKFRLEACVPRADAERSERRAPFDLGRARPYGWEDALTEIGVFRFLSSQADVPQHLLKMLEVFVDVHHAWLVTKFCEGGDFFEEVKRRGGGGLGEAQSRRHSWEILQAARCLHQHSIAHQDLSLENLSLLGGSVRVMDFGCAVQSHLPCGTEMRHFGIVGKPYYTAPECYAPKYEFVDVVAPLAAAPGDVVSIEDCGHPPSNLAPKCQLRLPDDARPGLRCRAPVLGYAAQPIDAFAVGICVFIMLNGRKPWGRACSDDKDYHFVRMLGFCWRQPMAPNAKEVVLGLTCADPSRRLSMQAALDCQWFHA